MPVKTLKKLMEENYFKRYFNPQTTESAFKSIHQFVQFAVNEVSQVVRIDQEFA